MSLDLFPPPPPWRRVVNEIDQSVWYINDTTSEQTTIHPLSRYHDEHNDTDTVTNNDADRDRRNPSDDIETLTATENRRTGAFVAGGADGFLPPSSNLQFRCTWKELGLFGDRQVFGLTIMYSAEDQKTLIKFDGIDNATWQYSSLEGPHGPCNRYDLFIGSRIKLFGRTLTISSASTVACHWIDREYAKLLKQQDYLITKVESVGSKPIVMRPQNQPMLNITRDEKGGGGRCDLRKVVNENARLGEQLSSLGLGHFVAMSKNLSNLNSTSKSKGTTNTMKAGNR